MDWTEYIDRLNNIEQQHTEVQANLDEMVTQTYQQYQQGMIDSSDLSDPYLNSRYYSPESQSGTWAISTFAAMGYEPPKDLSNVASMTVTDHYRDTSYSGILLSDGLPAGDTFETGVRYNATNLTGPQMVVTDDGQSQDLAGAFTIESIETPDGQTRDTLAYVNRTGAYSTTDLDEFRALQDELANLSAQIDARQQQLRNESAGGGSGLFEGMSGVIPGLNASQTALVILLGIVAGVAYLSREQSGTTLIERRRN